MLKRKSFFLPVGIVAWLFSKGIRQNSAVQLKMFAAGSQVSRVSPNVRHILSISTNLGPNKFLQTVQILPVMVDPFCQGPNIKFEPSSHSLTHTPAKSCRLSPLQLAQPFSPSFAPVAAPPPSSCMYLQKCSCVCLHVCPGVNGLCSPMLPPCWVFPSS